MGNDGGTVIRRSDIIKKKQNAAPEKSEDHHLNKWELCHMTQAKLVDPILSDYKGYLYNKESVLSCLIKKKTGDKEEMSYQWLNSLKDVKELKTTWKDGKLVCPITRGALVNSNKLNKFVYIGDCGCILSYKLIQELIKVDDLRCPNCQGKFNEQNLIFVNPVDETDVERNESRLAWLNKEKMNHNGSKKKRKNEGENGERKKRKKT